MCSPAAFCILRERVLFSPRGDLHDDILKEHGLQKSGTLAGGLKQGEDVVFVDLHPPGGNHNRPLSEWTPFIIETDGQGLPEWFSPKHAEAECRRLLPIWAKHHIITEGTAVCGPGETRIALGSARIQQTGGECWLYDHAKAEQLHYFGVVHAFDNSQVIARARVEVHNRAHIVLKGGILFTDPEHGIKKPQISLQVKVHSPDAIVTWECNKSSAFVDDRELRMRRRPVETPSLRPMGECL